MGARRVVAAIAGVVLCASLVSACGRSKSPASPGATVPEESTTTTSAAATTTTTSAAGANYDVPAVIDQAYVQRIVSAHDHVLGEMDRKLLADRAVTDEVLKYLVGLYTEAEFEFQQKAIQANFDGGFLDRTPERPGDPRTTVIRLERADSHCIIARADRDYSALLKDGLQQPDSGHDDYLVLVNKKTGRDPLAINATPWVMSFDGYKDDNSVPVNSCDD